MIVVSQEFLHSYFAAFSFCHFVPCRNGLLDTLIAGNRI